MFTKKSSSTIAKGLMLASLFVALMLPVAAFAEEEKVEAIEVSSEEAVFYSVPIESVEGSEGDSKEGEELMMTTSVDPEEPVMLESTGEEASDDRIRTMTNKDGEEVILETEVIEDSPVDTSAEVTDDMKRSVMLTSVEEDGTVSTSNQNILLYSVIGGLLAVVAVLGTLVYRKRQQ
jgi:hypothetical protein